MTGYVIVGVVAAAVLVVVNRTPRRDQPHSPRFALGATIWLGLIVTAIIWELANYFQSPRSDHPTMSSMVDAVVDSSAVAGVIGFVLWVALGIALARR